MPDSDLTLCVFESAFIFNRGEVGGGGGGGRRRKERSLFLKEIFENGIAYVRTNKVSRKRSPIVVSIVWQ